MTRVRRSRTKGSKKDQGKVVKTKRYGKDVDQIYEEVQRQKAGLPRSSKLDTTVQEPDSDELPGAGEHLCTPCSRYFISPEALAGHEKTKIHRRRIKELENEPYSQQEAELAAGLKTDNGRRDTSGALKEDVPMA